MLKIKKKIKNNFRKLLNIIKLSLYAFYYKKLKINEKQILIESKHGKELGSNMFYILKELFKDEYANYSITLVASPNNHPDLKRLFNFYDIEKVKFVAPNTLKYYKLLSSAKFLFNDSTFPRYFIKKFDQIYLNTWHGTPLKKMGRDIENSAYEIGNTQRNFLMSDYLLYPNIFMQEKMLDAYMLKNLFSGKILQAGYPRNSIFFDQKRRKKLKKQLKLDAKEIIFYMPTWRGQLRKIETKKQIEEMEKYLHKINKALASHQILYIKLHPFLGNKINCDKFERIQTFNNECEIYDFLNICDCLITDYSSIMFDFANARKKIILFTYDEKDYLKERGLYVPLSKLPFPKVKNVQELIKEINSPKNYDDEKFIAEYCTFDYKDAAKDICSYIFKNKQSNLIKIENLPKNTKENVLIYSGNLAKNGITTSLLSLLNNIDVTEKNYYITFKEAPVKPHYQTVYNLPVTFIPLIINPSYTFRELMCYLLFFKFNFNNRYIKQTLDNFYERERIRNYYNTNFDHVIHFSGYERTVINFFQRFPSNRIIYVHSNMEKEIENRNNQHKLSLQIGYNEYDKVAIVTNDMKQPTINIKGNDENIFLAQNFLDCKKINKKANEDINFDNNTVSNLTLFKLNKILNKNDYKKIITVGRFSKEKGHERLISAFESYYQKNKKSYLIIIGGHGPLYNKTLNMIESLNCKKNVIVIKSLSNPYNIIKKCDLFILSSFYEGFGLVLLEANVLGLPIVTTDISGPRTFMKENNGYLCDNSLEGLKKALDDFHNNKIKYINIDYNKYNRTALEQFHKLLND